MAEGRQENSPEGRHGSGDFGHVSVLLKEAIDFLAVRRGGTYVDATVGAGGHSFEIAKRLGAQGRLIGFDKDPAALEIAGIACCNSGSTGPCNSRDHCIKLRDGKARSRTQS